MSFLAFLLMMGGGPGPGEAPGELPGWEKTSYSESYTSDDLHKYVNGGAARYLAYSIQELRVQGYVREDDGFAATVEIYRMDSPHNAFGVYSSDRAGPHPEGIGREAVYEGGLLQFWQHDRYVRVQADDPSGEPGPAVLELGALLSESLPEGDSSLPEIVRSMPREGLVDDSLCFFHNRVTLNSIYYLSEENLLALGEDTDAVTAEYRLGPEVFSRVIVVRYPDGERARRAMDLIERECSAREGAHDGVERERCYAALEDELLVAVLEAPGRDDAEKLATRVLEAARRAERQRREENK